MSNEMSGIIKQWNDQKGFGFIKGGSNRDVFFHISALYGDQRPEIGDQVYYVQAKNEQGRIIAKHVRHQQLTIDNPFIRRKPSQTSVGDPHVNLKKNKKVIFQNLKIKIVVFIFLLVSPIIGSAQLWIDRNFPWAAGVYFVSSLITFYLYWSDKQHAEVDVRRIPEARLHFFEFIGGWIGAFIAQQLFRHKTRKLSFQCMFWLIVIIHEVFWIDQVFLKGRLLKVF